MVYDTNYPLPSLRTISVVPGREGGVYLLDHTCTSGVRLLLAEEAWKAHGGDGAAWRRAQQDGCSQEQLLMWALRAPPAELAKMEVALAASLMDEQDDGRVGVCS